MYVGSRGKSYTGIDAAAEKYRQSAGRIQGRHRFSLLLSCYIESQSQRKNQEVVI
jgi:hypothetical protein